MPQRPVLLREAKLRARRKTTSAKTSALGNRLEAEEQNKRTLSPYSFTPTISPYNFAPNPAASLISVRTPKSRSTSSEPCRRVRGQLAPSAEINSTHSRDSGSWNFTSDALDTLSLSSARVSDSAEDLGSLSRNVLQNLRCVTFQESCSASEACIALVVR